MTNQIKQEINMEKTSVEDISTLKIDESNNGEKKKKKNSSKAKHIIYIIVLLVVTALALFLSLYQDFDGIMNAILSADWRILLLIAGLLALYYSIDGLIIFVFVRLYTRKYKFHQSVAVAMVGAFYSAVTPGSSGGQIMQIYTMNKQGVEASHGASIMIMSYIVYQSALILLGAVAVIFKWDLIMSMGDINIFGLAIPIVPLTIFGFVINIMVILILFAMSYSHKFHNFILNQCITFLGKIKILKKPDETREFLRVQVENFKIELRRLISNIPIFILVFFLHLFNLILKFSLPFFVGIALNAYGPRIDGNGLLVLNELGQAIYSTGQLNVNSFFEATFLSAYHQMTTGLLPLPGSAGVSEYFFNTCFANYFTSLQMATAAQIIWRFMTFHIILLVSGIIAATYRSSPKGQIEKASRKTFVTLQFQTYELRKATSDSLYHTAQLSRKEIQSRLKALGKKKKEKNNPTAINKVTKKPVKKSPPKANKTVKQTKVETKMEDNTDYDSLKLGD